MPAYSEKDLSGAALGYYQDGYQRTVYKENQKLLFSSPVYLNDAFEMILLGTINTPMVRGVDWDVYDDDINYDEGAIVRTTDPTFDKVLINSVTMLRPYTGDYVVQCMFQQLYPVDFIYSPVERDNGILEVTPDLIGSIIEKVEHHQHILANQTSKLSPQSTEVKVVYEDRTGANPNNLIPAEKHDINTLGGVRIIRPIYGDFYASSLVVRKVSTGEVIDPALYKLIGVNIAKTEAIETADTIYSAIEFVGELVTETEIDYQAFGNVVDLQNFERVVKRMMDIERYLVENPYLTPHTLNGSQFAQSTTNRLVTLEEEMRVLHKTGSPTYADVMTNQVLTRPFAPTDNGMHWWTIAKLYRVAGSPENVLADAMRLRIQSQNSKMMFEMAIAANFDPTFVGDSFTVSCENVLASEDVLVKHTPKLRVIQSNLNGYSGLLLQLGMKLPSLHDVIGVENLSGRESCWLFPDVSGTDGSPEDNNVLLPDGVSFYIEGEADALVDEFDLPLPGRVTDDGTPVSMAINTGGADNTVSVFPFLTDQKLDRIKYIDAHVTINPGAGAGAEFKEVVRLHKEQGSDTRCRFTALWGPNNEAHYVLGLRATVDYGSKNVSFILSNAHVELVGYPGYIFNIDKVSVGY